MAKNKIIIYSGGLDSSALLWTEQDEIAVAISFNYGSRHNAQELKMAEKNCQLLGIEHIVVDISIIGKHLKSALLGDSDVPYGRYDDGAMKSTVVPFRNGIMLSIAAGIAESRGLSTLMLASHAGDHAIYPDCTPNFNSAMEDAIKLGTYNKIKLEYPFEDLDKKQVAQIGIKAGMIPGYTYSCYEGGEVQCGKCSTCRERDWALGLRKEP